MCVRWCCKRLGSKDLCNRLLSPLRKMSPYCKLDTILFIDGSSNIWFLCREDAGWFDRNRTLFCLTSNRNLVHVRNSPKIGFVFFSLWELRTFAPQRTAHAKKIRLCCEAMRCRLLFCSNSIFHLLVPSRHGVTFLPLFVTPSHFRPREQQMKLQFIWTTLNRTH